MGPLLSGVRPHAESYEVAMVRDLRTTLTIIIVTLIVGASLIFANAPGGSLINYSYLVVGRHIVPPPTDTPTPSCDCGRHADLKSSR